MRRRRLTVVVVAATVLVAAATTFAWTVRALYITIKINPDPQAPVLFRMTGDVDGLFPGALRELPLRVHNPNAVAIDVTRIDIEVKNASAVCLAVQIGVEHFRGHLRVPARSTVTKHLLVRMDPGAGDGCQGANFPLRYTGFGRPAP